MSRLDSTLAEEHEGRFLRLSTIALGAPVVPCPWDSTQETTPMTRGVEVSASRPEREQTEWERLPEGHSR